MRIWVRYPSVFERRFSDVFTLESLSRNAIVPSPGKGFSHAAPGELWRLLTRADRLLIFAAMIGSVGLSLHQHYQAQPGRQVLVEVDRVERGIFSLSRSQRLQIAGPLGMSEVEIDPRGVRIASAPCPHKICVRRGWVQRQGEVIACVPNRLILRIGGVTGDAGVDAVVR